MIIVALDLASVSGWAVGEPGGAPTHGTIRFASAGASHEAIFAKAATWFADLVVDHKPTLIVWEAPLPTSFSRGRTNSDTTSLLFGLPAVVGAIAYQQGIYDIRKAETKEVRQHFIGCNPIRTRAKPMVMAMCRAMGWDVSDDNEADALATWHYMCSLISPQLAMRPTPLFGRHA